ncbi:hypothetical protein LCGC14_1615520 [marine sediment metagenome]|uniref:Bacteriophage lambda Replication protein O N-terminal domain-containing protein n=1 Tax=marine sediment metagenome TaxID=412755 RepID=A0A0F9I713_9ZZZZ
MHNPHRADSKVNPQKEFGHREIENSLFQAIVGMALPGIEYQLVLCIIDKTWGWGKHYDSISLSQFKEATGQDGGYITRALKALENRNVLVIEHVRGRSRINTYMFNKHYDTWIKDLGNVDKGSSISKVDAGSDKRQVNIDAESSLSEGKIDPGSDIQEPNVDRESSISKVDAGSDNSRENLTKQGGNVDKAGVGNVDAGSDTKERKDIITKDNTATLKDNKGGNATPDPLLPETPTSKFWFQQLKKNRWLNLTQKEEFEKVEGLVGEEIMLRAVKWALMKGYGVGQLQSVLTTAKTMAKEGGQEDGRRSGKTKPRIKDYQET